MAPASFELIASLVLRETSIIYESRKEYLVEARLHPLAVQAGCASIDEYVQLVMRNPVERQKSIDALTINETSWFRDNAPYQAFTETMLPALLAARADRRRLSIWSAACSSGQEAYSIAMLLDQHLPAGWTADILATDVSQAMVERVRVGRYGQVEMNRGLPASMLVKHFSRVGSEWEISPELRRMVRTQQMNLAGPLPMLPKFDIVFLRNVLIYFDMDVKRSILQRIHAATAPDGFLLLGSAETTLDLTAHWTREPIGRVSAHRPATESTRPLSGRLGFASASMTGAGA
jgi:chemotaxis protein methyltransferase CheR